MNDRRAFLKSLCRLTLLGGLGAGLIRLLPRKNSPVLDETCRSNGVCRNCALLAKCGHPTARSFKEAMQ